MLPAAPEVMIVTTAGLTFAAAATTLPSAGVGAALDDPAVSTGAEEAGVTKLTGLAGVASETTVTVGRTRAPDATSAKVVPPEVRAAAASATAAIPAMARFRVGRADGAWAVPAGPAVSAGPGAHAVAAAGRSGSVATSAGDGFQVGAASSGAAKSGCSLSMIVSVPRVSGVLSANKGRVHS